MKNNKMEKRNWKQSKCIVKRVYILGMATMMAAFLAGCGLKTNAGAKAKEKKTQYNVKYMSSNETIKYPEDTSKLKIDANIKSSPEAVPKVKATTVKFDEKTLAKELLQEGMRTEWYQKSEPQYSGKNGDILNIDSDVRFYMLSDFYDNLFYCFHLSSRDPDYNADKYSQTTDFKFMSRQEALELVIDKLNKCGANIENYDATFYCLDYKTLKKEEYVLDKDGVAPKNQWKDKWTEDDSCYYIAIRPLFNDIPEYHPQTGFDRRYEDYCSPIQAIVSKDGIRYIDVDAIMQFENTGEVAKILKPQQVLDRVIEKKFLDNMSEKEYGKKSKYTLKTMNLCYFSNIPNGKVMDTTLVYQCYVKEKFWNGVNWETKVQQLIIDAKTGERVEVYDKMKELNSGGHQ